MAPVSASPQINRRGPDAAAELVRSLAMGQEGTVLNGITGSVGLAATLATLADGARLALANRNL